ncbi:hypothetical protein [Sphingomonas sp.]|uniref:hypothetical protein n=1 Tax=Sphingomonas sp. TaxID=28214 RepID=UPI0035BBDE1C
MLGFITSISRTDDQGAVRRPMPGDALGSALRSVYGDQHGVPDEMRRLLRMLDRPMRGH